MQRWLNVHTQTKLSKQKNEGKSDGSRPKQPKDNFGDFNDFEKRSAEELGISQVLGPDLSRSVDHTFTGNLTRFPDEGKM